MVNELIFDILDYRKKITSFSQSCIKLTTFGSNSHIFLAYIKKKLYLCSEIGAKEAYMTTTLTYNPRNRAARLAMEYIQSLGVFTITPLPTTRSRKKQQFEKEFRTAMKHAKAFRQGEMEFRSVDSFLDEL